jgi:hypothetical protein
MDRQIDRQMNRLVGRRIDGKKKQTKGIKKGWNDANRV